MKYNATKQKNGVDETACVTAGFEKHNIKFLRKRFELFMASFRIIITFYCMLIFID